MKKPIILALSTVALIACTHTGRTLPSATGTIYECLVVMPDLPLSDNAREALFAAQKTSDIWAIAPGSGYAEDINSSFKLVQAVMGADMPCLPQMEAYFKLTQVSPTSFDDFLRPTRNILYIDINPEKYTTVKAKVSRDQWATPQALYRIQSPDMDSFISWWLTNAVEVREWFVKQEIQRQNSFNKSNTNHEARTRIQTKLSCDVLIPNDYQLIMDTTLFTEDATLSDDSIRLVWCCNNKGSRRSDFVIYSYPYTNDSTFTLRFLNAKRDEVMGRLVSGSLEGTFMGTEYNIFPPQMRIITVDSMYTAEVRGLWRMLGGEAMGGPYVSHTRLDPYRARIVTAEIFQYAPNQKKRAAYRQAEAILYSLNIIACK